MPIEAPLYETLAAGAPHYSYFTVLVTAVFGLCVGSFLNVVIHRVPFGDSLSYPGSRCPNCFHEIHWYENIPVLSWVLLKARCSHCRVPIPVRYPAVELLIGLVFVTLHIIEPHWGLYLLQVYFVCMLIALAFIDIDYLILPDQLTFQLFLVGAIVQGFSLGTPLRDLLVDAGSGPLLLLSIRWIYLLLRQQEGIGLGDVKLMAGIGVFIGWEGAMFSIIGGSFLGSVVGIMEVLQKNARMQTALPFGPFLATAAILWVYWSAAADPVDAIHMLMMWMR